MTSGLGRTWTDRRVDLPSLSYGQRSILVRLAEGLFLYAGLTDGEGFEIDRDTPKYVVNPEGGMDFRGLDGKPFRGYGLFAALSYDEGQTWPLRRLITATNEPTAFDCGGNTGKFIMDSTHAEPRAYLDAVQRPDGIIQLVSSNLHYQFYKAWIGECARVRDGSGSFT